MTNEPAVIGPITRGDQPQPWSAPPFDLAARGYVMEEFHIEGEAARYALADGSTTYERDGRWSATAGERAPFRTRILVVRPRAESDFNGTVFALWLNVTAGFEYDSITSEEIFDGYAWVAVSAQRVGIEGFPEGFEYTGRQLPKDPLKRWDPARYGSLAHPGDEYSFDIFRQCGDAVRRAREGSPDPIGGLGVQRLIACGQSQSALRLTTYINAVHPLVPAFDGFLLTLTPGWAVPLSEPPGMFETRIRDDGPTPVMVVNSEWEASHMLPVRRPDSDAFRLWEVAGAPHAVADPDNAVPRDDGREDNPLLLTPAVSAAYRAMHDWIAEATPPPSVPPFEFSSLDPPVLARDEFGNVRGGLRLPELAAPVAEYHGRDDDADSILKSLYGWVRPFSTAELRSLYASQDDYRERYRASVHELLESRLLRPADATAMLEAVDGNTLDLGE